MSTHASDTRKIATALADAPVLCLPNSPRVNRKVSGTHQDAIALPPLRGRFASGRATPIRYTEEGATEVTMYSPPRTHNRRPVTTRVLLRVRSGEDSVTLVGRSSNLSHGGVFVRLKANLCPDCGVEVEIPGSEGQSPIVMRGVVVHVIKGEGVGIRFTDLSPEAQKALTSLIGPAEEPKNGPRTR